MPVAEGDTGPPGPIPNPVVKRVSADGYCGSNAVGDVAAAGSSRPDSLLEMPICYRSVAACGRWTASRRLCVVGALLAFKGGWGAGGGGAGGLKSRLEATCGLPRSPPARTGLHGKTRSVIGWGLLGG